MEVVVVYESDAASELRIERAPEDLLQVVLADIVRRMRFASKHDLHCATWCGQDLRQAIGIRENQLGTLVAGESPGESDRERVVVEQRRGRNDPGCAHMLMHPACARTFADEVEQEQSQRLTRGPQFLVRDVHHAIDHGGIVMRVEPVRDRGDARAVLRSRTTPTSRRARRW